MEKILMKHLSTLPISKMHGAGNNFVILDLRNNSESPSPELCRALADRHIGVGCDLILGVKAPRNAKSVAAYEIWTADGLSSKQCGNGARCIAAWVMRAGLVQGTQFFLDSPSGTHAVEVLDTQLFRTTMGVPQFAPEKIPLMGFHQEQELYEIDLDGKLKLSFAAVAIGNPHAVIEVNNINTAPVCQVGQVLQKSCFFLPTVNVGFMEIVSRDCIKLRVYEYGAGETLACGSGACAAAAVLMRRGDINRSVSVVLPGGELYIDWPNATAQIMLTGPAKFILDGEFFYASL